LHPGTLPPADLWTGRWPRPLPLASPAIFLQENNGQKNVQKMLNLLTIFFVVDIISGINARISIVRHFNCPGAFQWKPVLGGNLRGGAQAPDFQNIFDDETVAGSVQEVEEDEPDGDDEWVRRLQRHCLFDFTSFFFLFANRSMKFGFFLFG
jgi:hypothetical protein